MNLIIGSHVNVSGKDMLLGAVKQTLNFNANTFMFYTGAPQNTVRKPISEFKVEEAIELMKENNIDIKNVVAHAPYIINLANCEKKETYELAVSFLEKEINRVDEIGCKYLVLHPGSRLNAPLEIAIKQIIDGLNIVFAKTKNVVVLLETMAGKGSEVGRTFEEIKEIIDGIKDKSRIGVCLDTCHINDAGYDIVNNLDDVINDFDKIIGLDLLKVIHINDSKNVLGAHKDRHENFGFGHIGFNALINVIYHPMLQDKIKILETPWVNEKPPYKKEIEMIRNKIFSINCHEDLVNE